MFDYALLGHWNTGRHELSMLERAHAHTYLHDVTLLTIVRSTVMRVRKFSPSGGVI